MWLLNPLVLAPASILTYPNLSGCDEDYVAAAIQDVSALLSC